MSDNGNTVDEILNVFLRRVKRLDGKEETWHYAYTTKALNEYYGAMVLELTSTLQTYKFTAESDEKMVGLDELRAKIKEAFKI